MVDLMPRLANVRVRRTWRGSYPMTPDGFPVVGRVRELQGYINAVGMCGQGFMLGPGLATYLVKIVQDDLTAEDEEVLAGLALNRDFGGEEKLK
jgi:sarcosine oxidase subunit beta